MEQEKFGAVTHTYVHLSSSISGDASVKIEVKQSRSGLVNLQIDTVGVMGSNVSIFMTEAQAREISEKLQQFITDQELEADV